MQWGKLTMPYLPGSIVRDFVIGAALALFGHKFDVTGDYIAIEFVFAGPDDGPFAERPSPMRSILVIALSLLLFAPAAHAEKLLVVKQSPHSVSKTLDRLTAVMQKKGITIFARVDHAAGAKKVGMDMKPTQLLIFGNPKLGSPLMLAKREIGIDLPLKALAWQDDSGKVWLGYTAPAALKARHGVSGRDEVFKKMTGALDKLTNVAIKAE